LSEEREKKGEREGNDAGKKRKRQWERNDAGERLE